MHKPLVALNKAGLLAEYLGTKKDFYSGKIDIHLTRLASLYAVKAEETQSVSNTLEILFKNGATSSIMDGQTVGEALRHENVEQVRGIIVTSTEKFEDGHTDIQYSIHFISPAEESRARGFLKKRILELVVLEESISSLQGILNILEQSVQRGTDGTKFLVRTTSSRTH